MQKGVDFTGDWNTDKDFTKKIQFKGNWGGMPLSVTIINFSKDMFLLSIESPFFNVKRELMKKDILVEVDKIYQFLKFDPTTVTESNGGVAQ